MSPDDVPHLARRTVKIEEIHRYMLSLPGAVEERPFTPEIPVLKVGGKMFAYLSPDEDPPRLTIKLEPLHGQMLRSTHAGVLPGYHMNKDHWNTVLLNDTMPVDELLSWIDESYELVFAGLSATARRRALAEARNADDPVA